MLVMGCDAALPLLPYTAIPAALPMTMAEVPTLK
jgi:hypothetical protein